MPYAKRAPWLWPLMKKRKRPYTALRRSAARGLIKREVFVAASLKSAQTRKARYGADHFADMGRLGAVAANASMGPVRKSEVSRRGAAATNLKRWGARP